MADNTLSTISVYPQVAGFPLLEAFSLSGNQMVQLPAVADANDVSSVFYVQVTLNKLDTDPLSDYTVQYTLTPVSGTAPQLVQIGGMDHPMEGFDRIHSENVIAQYSRLVLVGETASMDSFKITAQLYKKGVPTGNGLSTTAAFGSKIYKTSLAVTDGILEKAWDGVSMPPLPEQTAGYRCEVTQNSDANKKILCNAYLQVVSPNTSDYLPIIYADNDGTRLSNLPTNLFSIDNEAYFLGQTGTEVDQSNVGFVYMVETDASSGQVTFRVTSGYAKQNVWMKVTGGAASCMTAPIQDFLFLNLPSVGSGGSLGRLNVIPAQIDLSTYQEKYLFASAPNISTADSFKEGVIVVQTIAGDMHLGYGPSLMNDYRAGVEVPLSTLFLGEMDNYLRLLELADTEGLVIKYTSAASVSIIGASSS